MNSSVFVHDTEASYSHLQCCPAGAKTYYLQLKTKHFQASGQLIPEYTAASSRILASCCG
jgi:hypothetical protein